MNYLTMGTMLLGVLTVVVKFGLISFDSFLLLFEVILDRSNTFPHISGLCFS